ncbi:MAG TPA: replication-relaxation family protein [Rhizomicrobium sp.]|nr:replication-relaxation family protein [Rhizomicrobium sp.]
MRHSVHTSRFESCAYLSHDRIASHASAYETIAELSRTYGGDVSGAIAVRMTIRRSRMHRTRTGKPLALTSRDVEIFKTLCRYRFLRSTYLHAFVGGESEKRFKERLGDLFHEGYLDRPVEQWRFADARFSPVVHELGKGGHDALLHSEGGLSDAITWLSDGARRQFEHAHMICAVVASIELAARDRSDIRFIPWPEILAKAPESTRQSERPFLMPSANGAVAPDAIFGLEYRVDGRRTYRFFALEADRGTMPVSRGNAAGTSFRGKLNAYSEIVRGRIHKARLGIPNLLVLTVTTSEQRVAAMLERVQGDEPVFLFKAAGALLSPCNGLLADPWQRAGQPALLIGQPS